MAFTLNNGNTIPKIGYGTGSAWFKSPGDGLDQKLIESIKGAIRVGCRHLDGAEVYGTEPELGMAIKDSGIPRVEFFITTKLMTDMSNIAAAFEASLEKLQIDYVNLYLIHAPFFAKTPKELQDAWAAMEAIYATGKAKSIGVSNFLNKDLEIILETATIKPAVNQVEFHPYLQQKPLLEFAKKHNITLAAYSPLTPITKVKGGPVDAIVKQLSVKYGVEEGIILLRWVLGQGVIVITTSSSEARMKLYLDQASEQELLPEEINEITAQGAKKFFRGYFTGPFKSVDEAQTV